MKQVLIARLVEMAAGVTAKEVLNKVPDSFYAKIAKQVGTKAIKADPAFKQMLDSELPNMESGKGKTLVALQDYLSGKSGFKLPTALKSAYPNVKANTYLDYIVSPLAEVELPSAVIKALPDAWLRPVTLDAHLKKLPLEFGSFCKQLAYNMIEAVFAEIFDNDIMYTRDFQKYVVLRIAYGIADGLLGTGAQEDNLDPTELAERIDITHYDKLAKRVVSGAKRQSKGLSKLLSSGGGTDAKEATLAFGKYLASSGARKFPVGLLRSYKLDADFIQDMEDDMAEKAIPSEFKNLIPTGWSAKELRTFCDIVAINCVLFLAYALRAKGISTKKDVAKSVAVKRISGLLVELYS